MRAGSLWVGFAGVSVSVCLWQEEWQREQEPNYFKHALNEIVNQRHCAMVSRLDEQVDHKAASKHQDQSQTFPERLAGLAVCDPHKIDPLLFLLASTLLTCRQAGR